jgi:hypothetical protein
MDLINPCNGSSHEQPPPKVFMQDLIESSIRLEDDSPVLGTPPDEGILTPTLETDPGTLVGPTITP